MLCLKCWSEMVEGYLIHNKRRIPIYLCTSGKHKVRWFERRRSA
jgi:hypothetical protein